MGNVVFGRSLHRTRGSYMRRSSHSAEGYTGGDTGGDQLVVKGQGEILTYCR